jgi:AraC-like DNA-binding protein
MGRILTLIHQRPGHHWTVAGLADAANLSRSGFAERFKMQVGTPPLRYVQRYRFSRAVELLQTTDKKICEVARTLGYASESSFTKAFKRVMGKTPGACRHQAQRMPC